MKFLPLAPLSLATLSLATISLTIFLSQNIIADEATGEQLYKTSCDVCHGTAGGMEMSKRIAPPMMAVKMHYKQKLSDRASFVAAIVDWLAEPDANKTKMRGAIKNFGIMPLIPVIPEDAKKIAEYVYDNEMSKPDGFDQHEAEMKAQKGKGKGKNNS